MVRQWDIHFANVNNTDGTKKGYKQPVLVVSNDGINNSLPVCTVIPMASYMPGGRIYPTEIMVPMGDSRLSKHAVVMVHQMTTIDTKLMDISAAGTITNNSLREKIGDTIRSYFDLF